jgi:uncharacterized protein (DUF58 family)
VNAPLPREAGAERAATTGEVLLSQRRVYILPTRFGLVFALTVALMLLASVNYNLSLGYVLAFLLAGLGLVALLHTWRNLAQLVLRPGRVAPVFAGEAAGFDVLLANAAALERASIRLEAEGATGAVADVPARTTCVARVNVSTRRRGRLVLPRLRVSTTWPLGLFRAWSWVELPMEVVVWPRPEDGEPPMPDLLPDAGESGASGRGTDDFAGLREYQAGDSLRHVAWKALARDGRLLTKQFAGRSGRRLWFDWMLLPRHLDDEARLSRLARWVLVAEAAGDAYGLRLPDREVEPDNGGAHRDRCLESLALYRLGAPER